MASFAEYRWIALQIVKWWCVAALLVIGLIVLSVLIDWIGRVGWGIPWYALPFAVVLAVVVWLIRRLAVSSLRSLGQ